MSKSFAIGTDFDTSSFVQKLAAHIDSAWKFSAQSYRVSDCAWRIVVKNKNIHSYEVNVSIKNNVLSVTTAETAGSTIKNVLGALAVVAVGSALGGGSRMGQSFIGSGVGKTFTDSRTLDKLEKMVDYFAETYFCRKG